MNEKFEITEIQNENGEERDREINRTVNLSKEFIAGIKNKWQTLAEKIDRIISNRRRETVRIIEENIDRLYLKACIVRYKTPFKKSAKYLNSLFLWEAYRFAREKKLSIPDEFFEYLDGCADKVLKIISKKGDSGVRQLDDAFELRDRYFSQYQNDKKMIEAYIRVKMIKEKDKSKTMDEIFSIVAKEVMHKEDDPNYDGAGTISHHYYKIDNKIEKEGHFPTIIRKIKIDNKNK